MATCTLCPDEATGGFKRCPPCRTLSSKHVATWRQKRKAAQAGPCLRHPAIALVNGGCRRCVAITGHVGRKAA